MASYDEALGLLKEVFAEGMPDRLLPADDEALFGPEAQLDSMELVAFVSDVEEEANERWGTDLVLADERAMSRSKSPFRSLKALAEYLVELTQDG